MSADTNSELRGRAIRAMAGVYWPSRGDWALYPEAMLIEMVDALEAAGLLADPEALRVRVVQLETQLAAAFTELIDRLEPKPALLRLTASEMRNHAYDRPERSRLEGKAQGVELALSFVREAAAAGSSLTPEEPTR